MEVGARVRVVHEDLPAEVGLEVGARVRVVHEDLPATLRAAARVFDVVHGGLGRSPLLGQGLDARLRIVSIVSVYSKCIV